MKIAIELPTWLGDCVMATPAIDNIISIYPDAKITFLGSLVAIEAMKYHPQVDRIVVLDKSYLSLYKIAKELGVFDMFFSFRSSSRSKILKFWVSAQQKFQFSKYQYAHGHQVEKYNNFVNGSLQVENKPGLLKLHQQSSQLSKKPHHVLGINPGASYGSAKRWYPEKFAKVAESLSKHYDIVIFGGPGEVDIASDIEKCLLQANVSNYQNLAGKTKVPELISQISQLDLFITGDSGPMHVAGAFQVPTVAIFGPTKDNETSQWMNSKSRIVKRYLDCQPCMQRTCPLKHHNCMRFVNEEEVLDAVNQFNL